MIYLVCDNKMNTLISLFIIYTLTQLYVIEKNMCVYFNPSTPVKCGRWQCIFVNHTFKLIIKKLKYSQQFNTNLSLFGWIHSKKIGITDDITGGT